MVEGALNDLFDGLSSAYDDLIKCVANNHSGTYYPILLGVAPFLAEAIISGGDNSQRVALCVVDDLFASFHSETNWRDIPSSDGAAQDMEVLFRQWVEGLKPELERIASGGGMNAAVADSILEGINSRN
jgi:hypothetical protein